MARSSSRYRFIAEGRDDGGGRQAIPNAQNFIEAALYFAEISEGAGDEIAVLVTDCETQASRCFRITLGTGRIEPC